MPHKSILTAGTRNRNKGWQQQPWQKRTKKEEKNCLNWVSFRRQCSFFCNSGNWVCKIGIPNTGGPRIVWILCSQGIVKCCRVVNSVPRWRLSLSWPIQSDHLSIPDWMIPPSGGDILMTRPSSFLESRSWWGHDCVKTKTTTYHIWPFYGASTSFFFGSNLSTSNSVITYEFTKFITWPAQFPAWSLKNFGYLSWKIPILKYTGKYSEEPLKGYEAGRQAAGTVLCIKISSPWFY